MIEEFHQVLEFGILIIEVIAVAIIVAAFFWGLVQYFRFWNQTSREEGFHTLQKQLGRALPIALEILVIADVIETITTEVTFQSLAVLAILVATRTALSWSLSLQVEGKWPWQPERTEGHQDA